MRSKKPTTIFGRGKGIGQSAIRSKKEQFEPVFPHLLLDGYRFRSQSLTDLELIALGGSDLHGYVGPRSVHEVAENAPELLTVGNKTLLMTGNQSGQVTPLKGNAQAVNQNITFVLQQPANRETQQQIGRRTYEAAQSAYRRNG